MCNRCGPSDIGPSVEYPHECPDCGQPLSSYGLCCKCVSHEDVWQDEPDFDVCPECEEYSYLGNLCCRCRKELEQ